ncbi:MAG TPA: peptidoglycan DD-metalloendopeptidase family protein [Actinomycetes bacterium]|jgi:murein DD-endopeptidase MepM/ murein hydrolase activator NlpD|nr:peptidoglycan DD-metalloendopeptidase family protein [Actinomycetes bacterium]
MRRAWIALLVAALLLGVAPVARGDTLQDVRDRVQKLRAAQEAAAARLDAIETELNELDDSLAYGRRRLDGTRQDLAAARRALDSQLAEVYRSGGLSMLEALLDPSSDHVPDRAEFIMLLLGQRNEAVSNARSAAASYDEALRAVQKEQAQARKLLAQSRAEQRTLDKRFEEARDLMDRLAGFPGGRSVYPSQKVISIDGYNYACPVEPPYSYVDSFGAPRSGGRTHEGIDIMAPRGAKELAFTDGVVSREHSNTLGGLVLWLDGDNGDQYYYAHLSGYAVPQGTRVRAGQHVAYVGNTGDARYTAPHLHFEWHPGGGAAANPYSNLKRVCG